MAARNSIELIETRQKLEINKESQTRQSKVVAIAVDGRSSKPDG